MRLLKPLIAFALLAGGAFGAFRYRHELTDTWRSFTEAKKEVVSAPSDKPPAPSGPWDGSLVLSDGARRALGIESAEVAPQVQPIGLELVGTTEYVSDTLTRIRPMFKGRVDNVHVVVGQSVKKGDPLVDLYSTALAEAKANYEIEKIQWLYDKKLLEIRESLLQTNTVSKQLYEETKNNEMKNRREYEVARDKLVVYGLTPEEIENVEHEEGSQKARLTLRSPANGIVINREVAVGNLYDENDTLLTIAPLDRLWVWGNVFEKDLNLVQLGQEWEIEFPYLKYKARGKVDYISNRVDPATHAVRIRTSIPNYEGKIKSEMLVRGKLEIPPVDGRTVVPRTAVIVRDGKSFVFVEDPKNPGRYLRRLVSVADERAHAAVIDSGLVPGERAVSVGGLVLGQMYEDMESTVGEPKARDSGEQAKNDAMPRDAVASP
jgi:cobalt-zinc-cadmium efflux system membrane fusion protein